ncbi:MAG TPA: hypothetical protein VN721_15435 [Flavipsychrobacter sp.]|nr:hypothetical protein [Flavipsychrobacter sp.]
MKKIILMLGIVIIAYAQANGQTGKKVIPKAGTDTFITHQRNAPEDSNSSKHKRSKTNTKNGVKRNSMSDNKNNANTQPDK